MKALESQVDELSSATDDLVAQAAKREERIAQLEGFLKMIAEADDR